MYESLLSYRLNSFTAIPLAVSKMGAVEVCCDEGGFSGVIERNEIGVLASYETEQPKKVLE